LQSQNELRQDDDQPMSTMEAARRLAFLLASAKEEQKGKMVDVTPDASDPERQTWAPARVSAIVTATALSRHAVYWM
jgi:hypothetical protein